MTPKNHILSLPDRCLSVPDAATYLTVTRQTLDNWRRDGTGPPYCRIGFRVVYRLDDLRQWADERRVVPGQAGGQ